MLPKINHPTFETIIPSTKKKIKFRPFLTKEYKLILTAYELKDETNYIETFKNILKECTFGKVDVNKLTIFDVNWLYLHIKNVSKGSIENVKFTCKNLIEVQNENGETEVKECNQEIIVKIDTKNISIDVPEKKPIFLNDSIALNMRWPLFEDFVKKTNMTNIVEITEDFIMDCIESISDKENTYVNGIDFDRKELSNFLGELTEDQLEKIKEFISNIPEVELEFDLRCPKCGNKEHVHLKGFEDFLE